MRFPKHKYLFVAIQGPVYKSIRAEIPVTPLSLKLHMCSSDAEIASNSIWRRNISNKMSDKIICKRVAKHLHVSKGRVVQN